MKAVYAFSNQRPSRSCRRGSQAVVSVLAMVPWAQKPGLTHVNSPANPVQLASGDFLGHWNFKNIYAEVSSCGLDQVTFGTAFCSSIWRLSDGLSDMDSWLPTSQLDSFFLVPIPRASHWPAIVPYGRGEVETDVPATWPATWSACSCGIT